MRNRVYFVSCEEKKPILNDKDLCVSLLKQILNAFCQCIVMEYNHWVKTGFFQYLNKIAFRCLVYKIQTNLPGNYLIYLVQAQSLFITSHLQLFLNCITVETTIGGPALGHVPFGVHDSCSPEPCTCLFVAHQVIGSQPIK